MSLCWLCSFPHRDVPVGAKNIPHRLRFTRALLESKDLSMRFSLPLCVWVSGIGPCSVETASGKRSPRTSYPPGWEMQLTGGKSSEPPAGKKRAYCPWTIRLPECVRPDWCLTGLSSAIACSSELGPRTTWRRVWVQISKNCQGLQQWDLCQGEGSLSGWIIKQVLCHKASAPHGENQAPFVPMLGV